MPLLPLLAGLVVLVLGAEFLVRGASGLARKLGLSPIVVGLTVVAYGTSMPEMAISVMSGLAGRPDVALGNVVGSNIFNVLFILGLSALVAPLAISNRLLRLDVPLMIGISFVVLVMGADASISRFDGALLLVGFLTYTALLIRQGGTTPAPEGASPNDGGNPNANAPRQANWIPIGTLTVSGLVLLVLGSRWFVDGAVSLARIWGISELTVGLTLVAGGTSLPEAATSIVASLRGERDIAVGNVVGSNIFNILAVLGVSSVVTTGGIVVSDAALRFDLPVMIAVAIACLPVFFTGSMIARWEGAGFFGYYVAYTLYLILAARQHEQLAAFKTAMIWFVLPLTAVTLGVVTMRSIFSHMRARASSQSD